MNRKRRSRRLGHRQPATEAAATGQLRVECGCTEYSGRFTLSRPDRRLDIRRDPTMENMPAGVYELRANAFQRPGTYDAVLDPYLKGTAKVTTSLFIGNTAKAVKHICDDRQSSAVFNDGGWGSDKKLSDNTYIPNCMTGAEKYFARGFYESSVCAQQSTKGGSFRVGIKCTSAPTAYWMMFDSFRLYFFGQNTEPLGVEDLMVNTKNKDDNAVYDLSGRKVETGKKLSRGLYIIGGKKVLIK